MILQKKESSDPLISCFSNRFINDQFNSNQNSKMILNDPNKTHRSRHSTKSIKKKIFHKLNSKEIGKMTKKKLKNTSSRKNIMKLNLIIENKNKKKENQVFTLASSSQENRFLNGKKQSRTISQLNLIDCVMSREKNKSLGRQSHRTKLRKKKKLTVDIAKLEKNLKLKKFNIKKNRLIDPTNTQRSRTKTSNKTQTNKKYKSKEKKIRLSTYLKTERHNVKKTMTPKTSTQVDLRQISLNRKKKKLYAKGKNPTCFEFMDKQKKQSFNSLKLLKN